MSCALFWFIINSEACVRMKEFSGIFYYIAEIWLGIMMIGVDIYRIFSLVGIGRKEIPLIPS